MGGVTIYLSRGWSLSAGRSPCLFFLVTRVKPSSASIPLSIPSFSTGVGGSFSISSEVAESRRGRAASGSEKEEEDEGVRFRVSAAILLDEGSEHGISIGVGEVLSILFVAKYCTATGAAEDSPYFSNKATQQSTLAVRDI